MQITEGWAIAINLLAMHMTETENLSITAMKPALHDMFSYLSDEVFKNMAETKKMAFVILYFSGIFRTACPRIFRQRMGYHARACWPACFYPNIG